MASTDHPNVELVRRGFAAMADGDLEVTLATFSPELKYYGGDARANFREFGSRDEFFAMVLEAMELNDQITNELIDAYAVGSGLVMAHIRGQRQAPGSAAIDMDYVMVLRIEDGVVTRGVDLMDADAQRYLSQFPTE